MELAYLYINVGHVFKKIGLLLIGSGLDEIFSNDVIVLSELIKFGNDQKEKESSLINSFIVSTLAMKTDIF